MEQVSNMSKEEKIFSQIKSYKDSQAQLTSLIESKISTDEKLPLILITDEWLEQWKNFSCYEEIKFNHPLNNKRKLREIRTQKKADEIIFPAINIRNLFINNNINTFSTNKNMINPLGNFHLITEECFNKLCDRNTVDFKVKFNCEIKAGKIMVHYYDKIIILYKNENKLNLIFLIFNNNNNNEFIMEKYQELQNLEMNDFFYNFGINPNCEKQEITIFNDKIIFLNKSYYKVKLEEEKFKNAISSLINHEFIFFPSLKSSGINNLTLYLINDNWLSNFKNSIKYLDTINKTGLKTDLFGNKLTDTINKIFEAYKNNSFSITDEIINEENILYYYLKENNSGNYIKLYSDYSLITEDLWINLIRFFKWNIEVKVNVYIIQKNIIVIYNQYDFEIYEVSDNTKKNNLFFHLFDSAKLNQVINEIISLGIMGYYNKYNITINQEKQSYFKLFDNMNICFGFVIDINAAKINFNEFSLMIHEQIEENDLKDLCVGYNAKNNIFPNFNNINNNIINNNFNNNVNIPNNIGNFNNQNIINNNIENLNNQFNNINLNAMNNMNNFNQVDIDLTRKVLDNQNKNFIDIIQNKNVMISEEENINDINHNDLDSTRDLINANNPNYFEPVILQNEIRINDNLNNNKSAGALKNMNHCISSNINFNVFKNNINSDLNPGIRQLNSMPIPDNKNNNFQGFMNNLNNQNFNFNPMQLNNSMTGNLTFPKNDILKSVVLCLENCEEILINIINLNEDFQILPIISSLKYIFRTKDYKNGLPKLKEYLNKASKQTVKLEEPKNVFLSFLDNINMEIGGFNSNQNDSTLLSNNSNNRDKLYEEFLNKIFNPINNTFISKNFFGIREVFIKCNTCTYLNYNIEIFKFIEFSVEEVNKYLVKKLPDYMKGGKTANRKSLEIFNNNKKNLITIKDCFDYYINHNTKINNMSITCRNCKEKSEDLNGKYGLKKMPKILCILLHNEKRYKVSLKLEEKLNVSKWLKQENEKEYNLICAIINSKDDDKYYALIKNRNNNNWDLYLDNNKKNVSIKEENLNAKPFLLIYRAID